MKDERIRRGATFEVTLTDSDTSAETVTITVSNDQGIVKTATSAYSPVDNQMAATLKLDTSDITVGNYEYMYTIEYDGSTVKLPETDSCGDEPCELPAFIVCEANDVETS